MLFNDDFISLRRTENPGGILDEKLSAPLVNSWINVMSLFIIPPSFKEFWNKKYKSGYEWSITESRWLQDAHPEGGGNGPRASRPGVGTKVLGQACRPAPQSSSYVCPKQLCLSSLASPLRFIRALTLTSTTLENLLSHNPPKIKGFPPRQGQPSASMPSSFLLPPPPGGPLIVTLGKQDILNCKQSSSLGLGWTGQRRCSP